MKNTKTVATIVVICVCVGIVFLGRHFLSGKLTDSHVVSARAKGNPKAKIKIVEYLDFQCPACARGAIVMREYSSRFPNDIYIEVKYFPITSIHKHTMKATMFAECAARQDKFWPFQDFLVDKQAQWSRLINPDNYFRQTAQAISIDIKKLDACLADDSVTKTILADKSHGKSEGVKSTPTYFINGKMFVGPKPLTEEMEKIFGAKNPQ